jgi:ABC-type Fe3+/spermidine/putrescine transport system ATPase subunit
VSVQVRLVELTKVYPNATTASVAQIDLTIEPGTLFALLGTSGCGKTTTLKMIAGLLEPTSGEIAFDGRPVARVPAERRNVAMVFQKPLLFPNMTIGENVAFGLRIKKVDKARIRDQVSRMLGLVRLPGVEDRRPGELSGGQEQRVALARALVTNPDVLLLDEPLSQLDANLRVEMRDLIRSIQRELGLTTIFVTHDQEEAVMLADRIALMQLGRLLQVDAPVSFYERPGSEDVARFFGARNFLHGRIVDGRFQSPLGTFELGYEPPPEGQILTIRQEAIAFGPGPNAFSAHVRKSMYLGTTLRVWVDSAAGVLEFSAAPGLRFPDGSEVTLRFPPEHVWVLPAPSAAA